MKDRSDARYAFLRDPDLYDLVGRLVLRRVRDEAFAEDIRQGAYVVAMQLVLEGKGPKPGTERGWMCRVARNHTFEALRARKDEEKPLDTDDEPDIPIEDQQTLHTQQMEIERRLDAAEEVASKHPEHVEVVLAPDGRTKEGAKDGAKDDAARKRKERSRLRIAQAVSAVLAVAVAVLLWMRGPGAPKPVVQTDGYASLAEAAHYLAAESCTRRQWITCLEDLERLERLDASRMGPREQAARDAAVAGIRQEALEACGKKDFMTCLEGLDTARKYDPAGESDQSVQLARSEAEQKLRGSAAPVPSRLPDAKPGWVPGPLHR